MLSFKIKENYGLADLIICNNVFAHVPDLHDFCKGLSQCIKSNGVISIEVPHLKHLIKQNQFDTIYHEHFSYFTLTSATAVLKVHGLRVFEN